MSHAYRLSQITGSVKLRVKLFKGDMEKGHSLCSISMSPFCFSAAGLAPLPPPAGSLLLRLPTVLVSLNRVDTNTRSRA